MMAQGSQWHDHTVGIEECGSDAKELFWKVKQCTFLIFFRVSNVGSENIFEVSDHSSTGSYISCDIFGCEFQSQSKGKYT